MDYVLCLSVDIKCRYIYTWKYKRYIYTKIVYVYRKRMIMKNYLSFLFMFLQFHTFCVCVFFYWVNMYFRIKILNSFCYSSIEYWIFRMWYINNISSYILIAKCFCNFLKTISHKKFRVILQLNWLSIFFLLKLIINLKQYVIS